MPKTKAQKGVQIDSLTTKLQDNRAIVLAEFSGLTMEELTALRKKAKAKGITLQIAKNTLLQKAAEAAGITGLQVRKISKQILVAFNISDEVAVSKFVAELAKGSKDKANIYSGIVDKKAVTADIIKQLSSLPSREELLAKVVGSLSAPISGFVRVINGPLQGFYNVVSELQKTR